MTWMSQFSIIPVRRDSRTLSKWSRGSSNKPGRRDYCLEVISRLGFIEPTPIQSQGWPMALRGRDLIAIAKTGSEKTLSYLLPAFVHVSAQPRLSQGEGPIVLVLAPTRELAVQIQAEAAKFGSYTNIRSTCIWWCPERTSNP